MAVYIADYVVISPLQSKNNITFLETIAGSSCSVEIQALLRSNISAIAHTIPSSSTNDGQYKTRVDFLEAIILRYSGKNIPEGLTPAKRREAIDSILNDPNVQHRLVFSKWPRPKEVPGWKEMNPPPYQIIKPENSLPGKMAPNGVQLWGSTLFDFFTVLRIPGLSKLRTFSSGSKLLEWCKANGEYEGENAVAGQCIAWAEGEKDPEIVPVYNVANLIRSLENLAFADESAKDEESREGRMEVDKEPFVLPQPWPPKSLFDPAAYPGPWAGAVPFSSSGPWRFHSLPVLEQYIPQSRLPKKLIVHDPWNLLSAHGGSRSNNVTWDEQVRKSPGRVYTYELRLSDRPVHSKRREADEEDLVQREVERKRVLDKFLANPHSSIPRPFGLEIRESYTGLINVPTKPVIYAVLPPRPPLAAANEGHLYLSRDECAGRGHHSYVYNAEWELPRSCLIEEQICVDCIMEDLKAILQEQDGENGETRNRKWDELSGKMVLKEVVTPACVVTTEGGSKEIDSSTYIVREGEKSREVVYEGPYRVIHSRVKYQNLARAPYCKHLQKLQSSIHPLTTKVRVTAKLSMQGDEHLAREARNYQQFPKHFFEHWSGFNILPPIHDPTPVGPLVPQFYGYYAPKDKNTERYLSPILLLEHCGNPINPETLSIDDKQECVSLALRLHEAEWVHGSFFQRNILRKPGPLNAHPEERKENQKKRGGYGVDWSFRFIDFGRSEYVGGEPDGIVLSLDGEHQEVRSWLGGFRPLG